MAESWNKDSHISKMSEAERRQSRLATQRRYRERNADRLREDNRRRAMANYVANREESQQRMRDRYANNTEFRERRKAAARVRYSNDLEGMKQASRDRHMWRKFKRTPEDYAQVLEEQGGGCAVCAKPPREITPDGSIRRLAWDHDHHCCAGEVTCGECVRGLVCTGCNLTIGRIEVGSFDPHVAYLEKWNR